MFEGQPEDLNRKSADDPSTASSDFRFSSSDSSTDRRSETRPEFKKTFNKLVCLALVRVGASCLHSSY